MLEQGSIRFVVTSALREDHDIARHCSRHGDGVKDIALTVPDATEAYRQAVQRGARGTVEPQRLEDDFGTIELSAIATYGDTIHTFVNRGDYTGAVQARLRRGPGRPGRRAASGSRRSTTSSATSSSAAWTSGSAFYERVFGMTEMIHFSDEDISTEYSALMSKVMTDGAGKIKFPLNEPAEGKRKSQIEEYLDFYGGPGAQHIAMATNDIVGTVEAMKQRGVLFLETPDAYYEDVGERVGEIEEDYADLRRAPDPRRPRRRRLPAADLHEDGAGPADALLRGDRAPRRARLRRRQLQGAVRGDRARAGAAGEPLAMPFYQRLGDVPRKRHIQFRDNGTLLTEEVMGLEGFTGNESILYHLQSPCRVKELGAVRADRARGVGARRARAPAPQDRRRSSRRATRSPAGAR